MIVGEMERELSRMLSDLLDRQVSTGEAEATIIQALSRAGQKALQAVIQSNVDRADAERTTPAGMIRQGRRSIWIRSLWGDFQIHRAYYVLLDGGGGCAPSDALTGLYESSLTPALARTMASLSAHMPFELAAEILRETTSAEVGGRQFHRLVATVADDLRQWTKRLLPTKEKAEVMYIEFDGTGVPMRSECLEGRKGRAPDGQARTREMRLGSVFTQTSVDEEGMPVRDPGSTSYLANLLDADNFGREVKAEALRRGLRQARQVVVLSDGAKWCEKLAWKRFPNALHILDFYHAGEHIHDLAEAILGKNPEALEQSATWRSQALDGKAADIVSTATEMCGQAADAEAAKREIAYLSHNIRRMHYDQYRQKGLFIGSGVIEAGCRTAVGQRAKMSGMHWGEKGVQDIMAIRCAALSNRIDAFWKDCFKCQKAA